VADTLIGVFDAQSDQFNRFTEEDVTLKTTLAHQVAVALQNARYFQEQSATVERLRELDQLKSSFLANMSHELRTPLNSILGFAQVMLEGIDGDITETMENDLVIIQKNGQHLLNLISDILDMAKIEAGKMTLNPEIFDLREVFDEVLDITGPLARAKSLELIVDMGEAESLELYADRVRLRQVMINIVNNGIKFTDSGSVRVEARRNEAIVRIVVQDTGIGIPSTHLETIFQEFTQVDASTTRKTGGTGLGLPISRHLIEMHGGRLWAESTGIPGQGSSLILELPVETPYNQ
jgi:signal transduction histidine kinase